MKFLQLFTILPILGLFTLLPLESLGQKQRYYNCDPDCLERENCLEKGSKPVCGKIHDIEDVQVIFPNKCAYDCANTCYSHQLVYTNGPCAKTGGNVADDDDDDRR
ncbi:unnamed protein product [Allacma fusca]|uniref:Uncharacterized protein n=1 Tax=Allacma fusca TaxID=39272 RepID=A0A8J2PPH6_9HEXA|nr:unnamed protein product [Allacma fusca]